MFSPLRRVAQRTALQPARAVSSYTDVVACPPTVRIPFGEKVGHGLLLALGVIGYPLHVIFKVADVRREEFAALEIPEQWENYVAPSN